MQGMQRSLVISFFSFNLHKNADNERGGEKTGHNRRDRIKENVDVYHVFSVGCLGEIVNMLERTERGTSPARKREFINPSSGCYWITVHWMPLCLRPFVPQKMISGGFWLMACLGLPVRWKSRTPTDLLLKPRQKRGPGGVHVQQSLPCYDWCMNCGYLGLCHVPSPRASTLPPRTKSPLAPEEDDQLEARFWGILQEFAEGCSEPGGWVKSQCWNCGQLPSSASSVHTGFQMASWKG